MDTIGLARGAVRLAPHDPSWVTLFEAEAKLLQQKLGVSAGHIQHVGSTAIPGILAKPIIDIAVPVDSLSVVDEWVQPLTELGYWNKGPQSDIPDRRFFAKGSEDKRTVYLHIVTGDEYQRLVAFRDTLRAIPRLAQEYSDLKATLASSLASDRAQYTRQKNDFIQNVLRKGNNSKTNLLALVRDLELADNSIVIFGGWAAELSGIKEPWLHSDIDLLLLSDDFNNLLSRVKKNDLKLVKSYAHKKAFIVNGVMAEVFLVSSIEGNYSTNFIGKKGNVVFAWPSLLFAKRSIDSHTYNIATKVAMQKYTKEHASVQTKGPWK